MHAEPSEHEQFESPTVIEQAVITTLLTSEHVLWTRGELERAIDGPRGTGAVVEDAIDHLYDKGLVHVFGDFVTPTRAAQEMDELAG
jgi:hypothetical protein